jgi:hypothetical protein
MKGSRSSVCPLGWHAVAMESQTHLSSPGAPRNPMVWFFLVGAEPPTHSCLPQPLPLEHTPLRVHCGSVMCRGSAPLSLSFLPWSPAGPDSDSDSELSLDEQSSSYASSHSSDSEDDGGETEDKWDPAQGPVHSTPKGEQWGHSRPGADCGWYPLPACQDMSLRTGATQDSSGKSY